MASEFYRRSKCKKGGCLPPLHPPESIFETMKITTLDKIISDRGSKYSVSGGLAGSKADALVFLKLLKSNKKFAKATHNTWGLVLADGTLIKNDDGESGAGLCILKVLEGAGKRELLLVVTRWYGGVNLGGDRFRHVTQASQIFLRHLAEHGPFE